MSKLEQLSRIVGIQEVVPTIDGGEQPVTEETKRTLLVSLGFAVGDDHEVAASLLAVEERPWKSSLPPVLVLSAEETEITVPVVLPAGNAAFDWVLTLEDGSTRTGNVEFQMLTLLDEREVAGRRMERRILPLGRHAEGYHTLNLIDAAESCRLILTPGKCWLPEGPSDGHRLWGLAVQLYLLKSDRNWGIGDFGDLRRLVQVSGEHGADIVGVNPLHAMFQDKPADASPYSPSDRLLLNVLYISIEELPELEACPEAKALIASEQFQQKLKRVREDSYVDYETVASMKLPVLRLLFEAFKAAPASEAHEALKAFYEERTELLDRSCVFQALRLYLTAQDATFTDSACWPARYRSYNAPGVLEFRNSHPELVRFQLWLQWIADRQLSDVANAARGMAVGLYRDLAVGSHSSGAETWSHPDLFAKGVVIGAPPDQFNPKGQNWGLPPLDPQALRDKAFGPFIDLLRANMRHAGALRIDHVMALRRLYWIPQSGGTHMGAYVHYPIDDLVGIIALESQRNRCLVIGEDLGGVPDGLRERLAEANILSYRVLSFERDEEAFNRAQDYPWLSLSVAGNHDLPTLAGWWSGGDIHLREKLKLFPTDDGAAEALSMRERDRKDMTAAFQAEGLVEPEQVLSEERFCVLAHQFLARTSSLLTMVQLYDIAQEPEQVNVPGTSNEHPNWRRKTSISLEQLASDRELERIAVLV